MNKIERNKFLISTFAIHRKLSEMNFWT